MRAVQASVGGVRVDGPVEQGQVEAQRGRGNERPDQVEAARVSGEKARPAANHTVRWNALARDLVAKTKTVPPLASRVYSVLSQVQYEALRAAEEACPKVNAQRVLREASLAVLGALFPGEKATIAADAKKDAPRGRGCLGEGSSREARRIGQETAAKVIEERRCDGHDNKDPVRVPEPRYGVWRSTANPPAPPLLPNWGKVTPMFMPALGDCERPVCAPPPALDSREFKRDLAEVRRISDTRTPDQLRIALFWAANLGTATPPGMWNEIASGLIAKYKKSDLEAARIMHFMNAAVLDAGIGCWETKYEHWLARPTHVDACITVPEKLGLPNFPSYTSGHATFSGAAAAVLGHFFPKEAKKLAAMADEAALSRVYGGIHYRFDGTRGVEHGVKIAQFALAAAQAEECRG